MRFRLPLLLVILASAFLPLAAQQSPATSPQPAQLLQRALLGLSGGAPLADITLTGTARRIAGSDDETGQAVLTATATDSRIDLNLPSGKRSEIRTNTNANPSGSWSGTDGVTHPIANHNLYSEPAWFSPHFALARGLSSSGYLVSYIGKETKDSQSVEHLTVSQQSPGPESVRALMQHLSQFDLYLDSSTLLPLAMTFNIHPDDNALLDIAIEVRFSDYRSVNGVQVPFHVQKLLNNGLTLDLEFQSAVLNSGLSARAF